MKHILMLLLALSLLLCSCQKAPEVYKTPNGTEFILPVESEAEDAPQVTAWTGDAITDELRAYYFQFSRDWKTESFPLFNYAEGKLPAENDLAHYAMALDDYWAVWNFDGDVATIRGDVVEAPSTQRFDYSLGLVEEDNVTYDTGKVDVAYRVFNYRPVQQLMEYRSVEYGDYTVISVKLHDYTLHFYEVANERELNYIPGKPLLGESKLIYDRAKTEGITHYEVVKDWMITGETAQLGEWDAEIEYTYMIQEGEDPIFLAYNRNWINK
ncbi:MAG: hypothetical protein IJ407_02355 [Clostridia bacterium]|nr:hypothetical protein [Clostridia bacterium]